MAVIIGSARHGEDGKISGGKAGDQTGEEVSRQDWYLHRKGWVCIRAKDADVREKIAQDMEWACDNPHIGYDQGQNYTLFDVAGTVGWNCSKVTKDCETDCARLVRVCVWYAGIRCQDFYTGDEVDALKATGQFDILTDIKYTTTSNNLLRGDILVTKSKGHTVVVLSNGKNIDVGPVETTHPTLRRGDKGDAVKKMQKDLRSIGFANITADEMVADGSYGKITMRTVTAFQVLTGITADGICGPQTWGMIDKLLAYPQTKAKAVTDVYYRTGPGGGYKILGIVKEGASVTYTVPLDDWIYIPAKKGWSKALYYELI